MTERTSPEFRYSLDAGRSRGSWRPRWPASATRRRGESTGQAGRTPVCTPGAGDRLHLPRAAHRDGARSSSRCLLPRDIADSRRCDVSREGFRPRYRARYREHRYPVWNGPPSPLRERTALGFREPLDVEAMSRAGSSSWAARLRRLRAADRRRSGRSMRNASGGMASPITIDVTGRRLPPTNGPPHGGRAATRRSREVDDTADPSTARRRARPSTGDGPSQGGASASLLGRTPDQRRRAGHEER